MKIIIMKYVIKTPHEAQNLLHWRRSIKHVWRVEIRWTVGEWRWRQKKTSIVILLTIKQSTNKQQYYSSKIHSQQIKQQWPEDWAEWTHPGSRRVTADNQHPSRRDVGPAMLSKVKKVKKHKNVPTHTSLNLSTSSYAWTMVFSCKTDRN